MKSWLERKDGTKTEIVASCYIGRTANNEVRIDSSKVSRRHALIHAQQAASGPEFWISDLGSTNGTIRNGRRVTVPCRLNSGDVITVGDEEFVFCIDAEAGASAAYEDSAPATVFVRSSQLCWLLMVDIKRYTDLSNTMDSEALGRIVGTWLRQCRAAIEATGGTVDKFLGDAIFAYWKASPTAAGLVSETVSKLIVLQKAREPDFRIVLHFAPVMLEGGVGGANNLLGPDVIYVFRMEKVCSGLLTDSILSEKAQTALSQFLRCEELGRHPLDGFSGTHALYKLAADAEQFASSPDANKSA